MITDCRLLRNIELSPTSLLIALFFTTINLSGYRQVALTVPVKVKITFVCAEGLFEIIVVPFGLKMFAVVSRHFQNNVQVFITRKKSLIQLHDAFGFGFDLCGRASEIFAKQRSLSKYAPRILLVVVLRQTHIVI